MTKVNTLYQQLAAGAPVTSARLAEMGLSADLVVHYVRAGWLKRLARGVFVRPDAPLELWPSLRLLERRLKGLHVGGKSALEWHGILHHVTQRPHLQLYGWAAGSLPPWFLERFPGSYKRLRLFSEDPDALVSVTRFQRKPHGPLVSDPERAVLELLSEVGVRQSLQDVRDVLEGTTSLRVAVLQDLLSRCRQVKTLRLCLTLGRELGLPWAAKLDPAGLPIGSGGRWVGRSKDGLLVLEPMR